MRFKKKGWVFAQTPIWAACDPNISAGAHRLLTYLAWRQGNDDSCWPSVTRIARDLGSCERTARRRLRELEEAGYLMTTHRRGRSNEYSLIADPDDASEKYTPTPDSSVRGGRSDMSDTPDSAVRGGRSAVSGTPVSSDIHDDKRGQEENDKKGKDEACLSLWSSILENLQLQMTKGTFDLWLAAATCRREGDTLFIQLANRQALEWVSQRLHGTICRTVRRVFEENHLSIVYEVE